MTDFTFKEPKPIKNYVTTRMPDDLRAKIQVVADKERRSLSSQIVFMLEQQIEQHENSNP
jgi:hypothetical protein